MSDPNKCPQCGRPKKPEFDVCFTCSQTNKGSGTGGRSKKSGNEIPSECVLNTFYKGDYLRREIFLEQAQRLADIFGGDRKGMSQSSIRSLFGMLKAMEQRIRVEKNLPEDEMREVYYKFVRHCEYQRKRDIIPESFLNFAKVHLDTATKNNREFRGFVEYLTSIMARMKTK